MRSILRVCVLPFVLAGCSMTTVESVRPPPANTYTVGYGATYPYTLTRYHQSYDYANRPVWIGRTPYWYGPPAYRYHYRMQHSPAYRPVHRRW